MDNKEATMKDIKAGKGLSPIQSDANKSKAGITTENRESIPGITHEHFAHNNDNKKNTTKNDSAIMKP